MYPKDKKTAALMSETIREVLTNKELFQTIVSESQDVPNYFSMLPTQDGITAMTTALMIKGMSGDVAAFTALSKFGFGEKVQMEVSDFYRTGKIDIQVVQPQDFDEETISPADVGEKVHEAITKQLTVGNETDGSETNTGTEQEHAGLGEGNGERVED